MSGGITNQCKNRTFDANQTFKLIRVYLYILIYFISHLNRTILVLIYFLRFHLTYIYS